MTLTATFALQTVAEASAMRIVDCLFGGMLIALLTGAALKLPPRKSAGLRFAVWFSSLVAIVTLPWLNTVLSGLAHSSSLGHTSLGHTNLGAVAIHRSVLTLPGTWAVYLFVAWAVIAAVCLLRLGVSLWQMRALRKSCVAVDPSELPAQVRKSLENDCGTRQVSLCTSARVQVPTALGLIAPTVVIPQWVMAELSPDELNQIVLHELAHLRRRDDWTNLAQKVIRALFFFHPAVWWIEKRVSLEREMACDDAVLATMAKPRAYAECLTHLAEKSFVRRTLALAQASLGPARQTFLRVSQILDANQPHESKHGWKRALPVFAGVFAVMASMGGVLAAKGPRLVAFENVQPHVANSTIATVNNAAVPMSITVLSRRTAQQPSSLESRLPHIVQARVLQAKNARPSSVHGENTQNLFVLKSVNEKPEPIQNLVLASSYGALPVTETVLFFVQRPGDGVHQQVVEIQWFRLTVFHAAPRSASGEIPKKT